MADINNFSDLVISEAKAMASAINGGDWDADYTDAQRVGWCLKAQWSINRYCGLMYDDIKREYGNASKVEMLAAQRERRAAHRLDISPVQGL